MFTKDDYHEGLYSCVGVYFPEIVEGKFGECVRARYSTKRGLSNVSRNLMRDLQLCDERKFSCIYNTQSTYYMGSIGRYLTENIREFNFFLQSK
jgi:hypothetical protein